MTLNGHFALKSVSVSATNRLAYAAFGQNCSKICNIHGGSLERERQMRVGWPKIEIFASFARYIFRTFTSKATFIILYYHVNQKKNMSPNFCLYLHQILTDFKNSFTGTLCGKFAVTQLLNILPHLNCVATLPCEI